MKHSDFGRGSDRIGVGNSAAIADGMRHESRWKIERYDADLYERRVRPVMSGVSEALILAQYHYNRGDYIQWDHYIRLAEQWQAEAQAHAYDVSLIPGNLLLNEGINEAWKLIVGAAATAYNNANARLGVGDSSAAEAATQTDLQAATNKLYKAMEAGYPTTGAQKGTWRSVYASADANFAWNEFTVDNGATAALNLNRKVSAQGTKASGQTWTLTLDITLS